jgi:hypothetical protein
MKLESEATDWPLQDGSASILIDRRTVWFILSWSNTTFPSRRAEGSSGRSKNGVIAGLSNVLPNLAVPRLG